MDKREAKLRADYAASRREGECLIWRWKPESNGYGVFRHGSSQEKAHRAVYELFVGSIPKGLQIDHLCRTRNCVEPTHLEVVTQKENIRRGNGNAGVNHRKTHCIKGHEFTQKNTIWIHEGRHRNCRTCEDRRNDLTRQRPKRKLNHCFRAHEFTDANTIIEKDGRRRCRTCVNAAKRKRRLRAS